MQEIRKKKNAASGDNSESGAAGQGAGEAKRALYHCNYCNKDLARQIRIKCVVCPDFDLCVECFSVGTEVTPHKSNHAYRVMIAFVSMIAFVGCQLSSNRKALNT
ncbi:putative transcriptional adaptor 2 [Medicago truncatula]|uniref:Putative transcriptional adaptor 2 n=1 Tax=Medicago truncatula TaxID=3880 RepID=A0A396GYB9_MEDTR|nr:putative transcriptional adaptor 2 [Medicago truncatula]